jgi:hypothetical protein
MCIRLCRLDRVQPVYMVRAVSGKTHMDLENAANAPFAYGFTPSPR